MRHLRFGLVRSTAMRFAIVSLVPVVALGWFLSGAVRNVVETRTADVYGTMSNVLFKLMSDALLKPADFDTDQPLPADRAATITGLIDRMGAAKGAVSVKVVNRNGRVTYANDGAGIGTRVPATPRLREALAGKTATAFVEARRDNGRHERTIEIDLPIRFGDSDRVYGALIASRIDPALTTRIEADLRRIRTTLAIGLAALWLSLFPISMSVSRRLRKKSEENEYLALHDTLTGLPNRNLLADRLDMAIAATGRTGESVGLLLIDLDGFKEINDTLGHGKGDELLQRVAERLGGSVRVSDTVARLGGDEFAVVVAGVTGREQLADVAERVTHALTLEVPVDGIDISIKASIGGSLYPDHAVDAEQLLQHADIAMYAAKAADDPFVLYTAEIDSHSPTRLALTAELRRAIADDGQLVLHYQPVANPATGEVKGMEALVRWQHPTRGLLYPADFIPLAEHSGTVRGLTSKVIDLAIAQAMQWRRAGHDLSIAVNLSAYDLRSKTLLAEVAAALARHGLPSDRLELEVTETGILADPDAAVELVTALRSLGVRVALDDFGTGYSSLTYLKRLAPDRLKIDRSFVDAMTHDQTDAEIVRSLIELAHGLSMGVTAEGVETQQHLELLSALSCDLIQGYYLARPLDAGAATEWLGERSSRSLTLDAAPTRHATL